MFWFGLITFRVQGTCTYCRISCVFITAHGVVKACPAVVYFQVCRTFAYMSLSDPVALCEVSSDHCRIPVW